MNEETPLTDPAQLDESIPTPKPKTKRRRKWPVVIGVVAVIAIAAGVGFWIWHETPGFCGTVCHNTMGSYVESYENSDFLVADHAAVDLVCLDCHEADIETQLAELQVQVGGDYRLPFAKMETDDNFCLRDGCHTREEIVGDMSNYVTDKGDQVNPHEITFTAQGSSMTDPHSDSSGETIACSTCHSAHRKSLEIDYCFGCHHNQTFQACSDCHDNQKQV